MSDAVIDALAVTCELTGAQWSKAALSIAERDLSPYPDAVVLAALERCRQELQGRLTLAAILERVEAGDGRPGAEQAWAEVARALGNERVTIVTTEEQKAAFHIADNLAHDPVAARMAFKEAYIERVACARAEHRPVQWIVTTGWDTQGREGPIREALRLGRLDPEHTRQHLLPNADLPAPTVAALFQTKRIPK